MEIVYIILFILLAAVAMLLAAAVCTAVVIRAKPGGSKPVDVPDAKAQGKAYAEKLAALIRHETIANAPGVENDTFRKYHAEIEKTYPIASAQLERIDLGDNYLALWRGTDPALKPILLMAHADVVEADPEGWAYPPFSGALTDDAIYGRGTLDTKNQLAAYLSAIEDMIAAGKRCRRDVYLLATCNEENLGNGASLACDYFKSQNIALHFTLDEGGVIATGMMPGMKTPAAMVAVTEKGRGDIKFIAKCNGGHSSTPAKDNPFARLSAFMARVSKKHPFKRKVTKEVNDMFRAAAPYMSFSMRLIFANLWLFAPVLKLIARKNKSLNALLTTTAVFTMAQGSGMMNVIPDSAWVGMNLRFASHTPGAQSYMTLKRLAAKYKLKTETFDTHECAPVTSVASEGYRFLKKTVTDFFAVPVIPYVMTGLTHSRMLAPVSPCVLRFGAFTLTKQQIDSIHGKNEFLTFEALAKAVKFYGKLLEEV